MVAFAGMDKDQLEMIVVMKLEGPGVCCKMPYEKCVVLYKSYHAGNLVFTSK
jgi:hypothetical protein